MNTSLSMNPIVSQSDALHPNTSSPLLCDNCQYLNSPSRAASHVGGYASKFSPVGLEKLKENPNCIVCQAVVNSVETYRKGFLESEDLLASQIFVRNNGPSFLEDYYHTSTDDRYDARNPEKIILQVIFNLSIYVDPRTVPKSDREAGHEVISAILSDQDPGMTASDSLETYLFENFQEYRVTPQYCLVYSPGDQPELLRVEPWEVPYFDVSLLSDWVRDCEIFHGDQCTDFLVSNTQSPELSCDFRVIDVRSLSVIKPNKIVTYAALSYVWRQATPSAQLQLRKCNLEKMSSPGGLNVAELPAVISDTIALCRDIEESYLWVDRLCIVQDDPESKHSQICGMDKIYRSAAFTIVAASEGPGLPGYFGRPRKSSVWGPPRDCRHEDGGVNTAHMQQSINPSLWNRRGWTFQERVLSRRRIFITDFQVIFDCSKGGAVEEFTWAHPSPVKRQIVGQPDDQTSNLRGWVGETLNYNSVDYNTAATETLGKYCAWVQDYTSRQLTFDSDILNAFAGVSGYLSESFATPLLFGLPEKYIDKAILWSNSGSAELRHSTPYIPSWSWAAWKEEVGYGKPKLEDQVSLVYFHYQDPLLGLRKLDQCERWLGIEKKIEDFRDTASVPETSVCMPNTAGKYMPGEWRSTRTWQACPHSPWQALAHVNLDPAACNIAKGFPGSLVFNTTIASLKLRPDDGNKVEEGGQAIRYVAICAENGEKIGVMYTQIHDFENYHDFIVICGGIADFTTRKALVTPRLWGGEPDYDSWRLYVMAVERLPFESFVGRRVDFGYVFAHKWHMCNPRWETVVLG